MSSTTSVDNFTTTTLPLFSTLHDMNTLSVDNFTTTSTTTSTNWNYNHICYRNVIIKCSKCKKEIGIYFGLDTYYDIECIKCYRIEKLKE